MQFIQEKAIGSWVEMDTVIGTPGGKVILTVDPLRAQEREGPAQRGGPQQLHRERLRVEREAGRFPVIAPIHCRFYPTCSAYFMQALEKYGLTFSTTSPSEIFASIGSLPYVKNLFAAPASLSGILSML